MTRLYAPVRVWEVLGPPYPRAWCVPCRSLPQGLLMPPPPGKNKGLVGRQALTSSRFPHRYMDRWIDGWIGRLSMCLCGDAAKAGRARCGTAGLIIARRLPSAERLPCKGHPMAPAAPPHVRAARRPLRPPHRSAAGPPDPRLPRELPALRGFGGRRGSICTADGVGSHPLAGAAAGPVRGRAARSESPP